jgi:ABC-2 type transport system ATP-binding protein
VPDPGQAVCATALTKSYPRLFGPPQPALRGLTLEVPRGSAFGLIGPNGAGKTTFIKLLLGVARPSGGEVTVLGESPDELSARARVGYLPERLHLPPAWTPLQFLASLGWLTGPPTLKEPDPTRVPPLSGAKRKN